MTFRSLIYLVLVLALVLSAAPVAAQVRIQLYSTTAKNNVIPAECKAELAIIQPLLAKYHSPSWTWIVACTEDDWDRVATHTGQHDQDNGLILGVTYLEDHITYIRGYAVLHPFNDTPLAQPDHTIAHELGHIMLNTHNEVKAEKKGMELLSEPLVAKAP